jgi:hydroxymethylpyrimidine/phosphomethylpyrimidine kinase
MALAPCLLGYGAVAKMLHGDVKTKRDGNIYWTWIENYVAEDYVTAVRAGSGTTNLKTPNQQYLKPWLTERVELLERHAVLQSPARIQELIQVFIHATKVRIRRGGHARYNQ